MANVQIKYTGPDHTRLLQDVGILTSGTPVTVDSAVATAVKTADGNVVDGP